MFGMQIVPLGVGERAREREREVRLADLKKGRK